MRIVHKLLLATVLPAMLIWTVGIYATSVSQRSLREAIEATALARARAVMDEIDRIVQTRTAEWNAYSRSELVQSTLARLQSRVAHRNAIREDMIATLDEQWQATPADEIDGTDAIADGQRVGPRPARLARQAPRGVRLRGVWRGVLHQPVWGQCSADEPHVGLSPE